MCGTSFQRAAVRREENANKRWPSEGETEGKNPEGLPRCVPPVIDAAALLEDPSGGHCAHWILSWACAVQSHLHFSHSYTRPGPQAESADLESPGKEPRARISREGFRKPDRWVLWIKPVIAALGRLRWEKCRFEASLGYLMRPPRQSRALCNDAVGMDDPCLF